MTIDYYKIHQCNRANAFGWQLDFIFDTGDLDITVAFENIQQHRTLDTISFDPESDSFYLKSYLKKYEIADDIDGLMKELNDFFTKCMDNLCVFALPEGNEPKTPIMLTEKEYKLPAKALKYHKKTLPSHENDRNEFDKLERKIREMFVPKTRNLLIMIAGLDTDYHTFPNCPAKDEGKHPDAWTVVYDENEKVIDKFSHRVVTFTDIIRGDED